MYSVFYRTTGNSNNSKQDGDSVVQAQTNKWHSGGEGFSQDTATRDQIGELEYQVQGHSPMDMPGVKPKITTENKMNSNTADLAPGADTWKKHTRHL